MANEIFYLCASVRVSNNTKGASSGGTLIGGCTTGIMHFYIRALDDTNAGAIAHDLCDALGLVFVDYVYLPTKESPSTLHPPIEHKIAYLQAEKEGVGLVLSVVTDRTFHCVDAEPFLR